MALTIVVLSGGSEGGGELTLTLDTPRLVIGRGEGCEVRLPDPSVSHRHASLRQRGGEYVILDENSQNGTFLGKVRLPPQTPRAVRSGERIRVGRVWIEVRMEPAIVKGSTAAAAKEIALALVARGMEAQGEEPGPRVTVLEGPDLDRTLIAREVGRSYVIGRRPDADLRLTDDLVAGRHALLVRKGDALAVQDTGSSNGTSLDGARITEALWKPGQVLEVGGTRLGFDYPAAEALAEIERGPDERMGAGEVAEPPSASAEAEQAPAPTTGELDATPTPSPSAGIDRAPRSKPPAKGEGGWGLADSAVVFLALGVLAVSMLGAWFLLGR
jgi:pSer/pThr/pTyr-binding forkhead associated (FHA) protein